MNNTKVKKTSKDIIHFQLYSWEEFTDYKGVKYELGGLHLMSNNFKFLLKAAYHQYEAQRINRIYIRKDNFTKWKNSKEPNEWKFFLDFSNGKTKPPINWNDLVGIIDMNKIKKKILKDA